MAVYPNNYRTAVGFLQNYTFLGVPAYYFYNSECGTGAGSRLNIFVGDAGQVPQTASAPNGYGMKTPFPPIKAGGLSSTSKAVIAIAVSGAGALGVPMSGTASMLIDTNTPAGQLIVSGGGSASLTITPVASVLAALFGAASASFSLTSSAESVAIGWAVAGGGLTITPTLTRYAVGNMAGSTIDSGALTVDGIVSGVWSALAADYNHSLTMGQKLNSAASGGVDYAALGLAVRDELQAELLRIIELAKVHGLVIGADLVVTPTSRTAGSVAQTIATDGSSTTVSRAP